MPTGVEHTKDDSNKRTKRPFMCILPHASLGLAESLGKNGVPVASVASRLACGQTASYRA
jgi:hypothetical protein